MLVAAEGAVTGKGCHILHPVSTAAALGDDNHVFTLDHVCGDRCVQFVKLICKRHITKLCILTGVCHGGVRIFAVCVKIPIRGSRILCIIVAVEFFHCGFKAICEGNTVAEMESYVVVVAHKSLGSGG